MTMRRPSRPAAAIALVAALLAGCGGDAPIETGTTMELRNDWLIAAAAEVDGAGGEIAAPGFDTSGWTPAAVPSTPMAALVQSGEIDDPYFDRGLERVPASRFDGPWWYRTAFTLDAVPAAGARLELDGVNYSADVWLNGERVAGREQLTGAFRTFSLDVAGRLVAGTNVLAALVYPPQPGDPTIGFVDWNPMSPDRNMGLWRPVRLRLPLGVALDDVFVRSDLDPGSHAEAAVTVIATLRNDTEDDVSAVVTGRITGDVAFSATETRSGSSCRPATIRNS